MTGIGLERRVYDLAQKAGFTVTRDSPPIRCETPVLDKNGLYRKRITNPDLFVKNNDGRTMFVEVTMGEGNNERKAAQKRVVEAAGVTNYVLLTGSQIEQIERYDCPQDLHEAFAIVFDWLDETSQKEE